MSGPDGGCQRTPLYWLANFSLVEKIPVRSFAFEGRVI